MTVCSDMVIVDRVTVSCSVVCHQGAALVHIYLDGSVLVSHGGVESGQGLHTKMIQVLRCVSKNALTLKRYSSKL